MSRHTRREWLKGVAAAGSAAVGACDGPELESGGAARFPHGVASGDPQSNAIVLWTRVAAEDSEDVVLRYEVGRDEAMSELEFSGSVTARSDRDHTVKLELDGLDAGTTYHYRFVAGDDVSEVGRFRTPAADANRLRLGVVACSSYRHGYFHAYRELAERDDLDAVIHLGDYVYESGNDYGELRAVDPPHTCVSLDDYRRRHRHYHSDPDLKELRRRHAMIVVWDDHEVANNAWRDGAPGHDPERLGAWSERRAAGMQAFFEWVPVPEREPGRVHRVLGFGPLADLSMVDARQWGRSAPVYDPNSDELIDPERSILGLDQEQWLLERLEASTARWKLIGNQVMVAQLPQLYNGDAWDGYPESRRRLLTRLEELALGGVVVLTGDIHMSWAFELTQDPLDPERFDPATGEGAVAVEFTVPGVTSPGLTDEAAALVEPVALEAPHVRYAQLSKRGYLLLDIDEERLVAEYRHFDRVDEPDAESRQGAVLRVVPERARIERVD